MYRVLAAVLMVLLIGSVTTVSLASPLIPEIGEQGESSDPGIAALGVNATLSGPSSMTLYSKATWRGAADYDADVYGIPLPFSWEFEMGFWNAAFDSYRVTSGNVSLSEFVSGTARWFSSGYQLAWNTPLHKYANIEARAIQTGSYKTVCNAYLGCCWSSGAYVWTDIN